MKINIMVLEDSNKMDFYIVVALKMAKSMAKEPFRIKSLSSLVNLKRIKFVEWVIIRTKVKMVRNILEHGKVESIMVLDIW